MNKEKRIIVLEHEIKYYETVYPGCSKLERLKEELKIKEGKYVWCIFAFFFC